MARIVSIAYGETFVQEEKDGIRKHNLNGLFSKIELPFIPSVYSFCLNIGLDELDLSREHDFQIRFINEAGKASFDTGIIKTPIFEDSSAFNMSLDIRNIPLEQEGDYFTEVYVNSELLIKSPITVRKKTMK